MRFYFQYAFRNLWRSRRWSAFAVFSVAAGVAAVVALRSLGLAIGDSLTSNVRSSNHGDIALNLAGTGFFSFRDPDDERYFSASDLRRVENYVTELGGTMTAYIAAGGIQISALDFSAGGRPQFISSLLVDTAQYPLTRDIFALDPAGVPLSGLFSGGSEVVISENLAKTQNIKVGDRVRVSGTEAMFVVRGIVPTTAEAGFRNIFAAFFGFVYFDLSQMENLPVVPGPNSISIILPDGTAPEAIEASAEALEDMLRTRGRFVRSISTPELLRQNQTIADVFSSFIVVMGLGALLIGGVGIINTMLVMVRRRTEEVAALKTFGLKGRQIAALFMAEAALLGVAGSVVGGMFGVLLSSAANAYGATLIQQPLTWRFYPEAVVFGLALGMVITLVFGVLPVLSAARVRPNIILRPNETHIPRVGVLHSLLALALVVVVVGLIAGQIISPTLTAAASGPARVAQRVEAFAPNPYLIGIVAVGVTLLILGLLVLLLWVVVWVVSRMPSFGLVDLRLALRNMTTRRIRTATTLLALSAGMFALSSIAFVGASVQEILQYTLSESLGGNVMMFGFVPPLTQPLIETKLNSLGDNVRYRTRLTNQNGVLTAVDGVSVGSGPTINIDELIDQINEAARAGDQERVNALSGELNALNNDKYLTIVIRDTDNPNFKVNGLVAGRTLTPADRGKPVTVVRNSALLAQMGAGLGSMLRIEVSGRAFDFEIVGIYAGQTGGSLQPSLTIGDMLLPSDSLPGVSSMFQLTIIQVDDDKLGYVLSELITLPGVYSVDLAFFDGLLRRLIDQMSAIPVLVGLLSLGAAAVIMANTVALSTLERRRQIGILKAVGLKGRRVMRIMLLENIIVCALGGLLGLGLSAIGVALMTNFGLDVVKLVPNDALPVAAALMLAALAIGWLATVLSARVAVNERVLNVLRYE